MVWPYQYKPGLKYLLGSDNDLFVLLEARSFCAGIYGGLTQDAVKNNLLF